MTDTPIAGRWVPDEPTEAMLAAGRIPTREIALGNGTTTQGLGLGADARTIYRAMLAAAPAAPAPAADAVRPEDTAEAFIQAAIDSAPEPLRRLGEWLANKLDEDDWKTADRLLTGAAVSLVRTPPRPADGPAADAGMRAPSWIANCCRCGRVVDTREASEGGDAHGAELQDGRWVCSCACYDAAQPDAPPEADVAGAGAVDALVKECHDYAGRWVSSVCVEKQFFGRVASAFEALQAKLAEAQATAQALDDQLGIRSGATWQEVDALHSEISELKIDRAALAAEVERLRERVEQAAEDERDRLYATAQVENVYVNGLARVSTWLADRGAMVPAARAAARAAKGGA